MGRASWRSRGTVIRPRLTDLVDDWATMKILFRPKAGKGAMTAYEVTRVEREKLRRDVAGRRRSLRKSRPRRTAAGAGW
jgi:hypothetical protein